MKVFIQNRDFRQLTINQWISTVGDTIFYLAFLNYVADASFAPLAILLITISETVPQVLQIFMGVLADFQHHRVLKYTVISLVKFVLYAIVALSLSGRSFFLMACILYLFNESLVGYIELLFRSHANSYFYKNHWERTSDRSYWL